MPCSGGHKARPYTGLESVGAGEAEMSERADGTIRDDVLVATSPVAAGLAAAGVKAREQLNLARTTDVYGVLGIDA